MTKGPRYIENPNDPKSWEGVPEGARVSYDGMNLPTCPNGWTAMRSCNSSCCMECKQMARPSFAGEPLNPIPHLPSCSKANPQPESDIVWTHIDENGWPWGYSKSLNEEIGKAFSEKAE